MKIITKKIFMMKIIKNNKIPQVKMMNMKIIMMIRVKINNLEDDQIMNLTEKLAKKTWMPLDKELNLLLL